MSDLRYIAVVRRGDIMGPGCELTPHGRRQMEALAARLRSVATGLSFFLVYPPVDPVPESVDRFSESARLLSLKLGCTAEVRSFLAHGPNIFAESVVTTNGLTKLAEECRVNFLVVMAHGPETTRRYADFFARARFGGGLDRPRSPAVGHGFLLDLGTKTYAEV